jgi:hypothetical protein
MPHIGKAETEVQSAGRRVVFRDFKKHPADLDCFRVGAGSAHKRRAEPASPRARNNTEGEHFRFIRRASQKHKTILRSERYGARMVEQLRKLVGIPWTFKALPMQRRELGRGLSSNALH